MTSKAPDAPRRPLSGIWLAEATKPVVAGRIDLDNGTYNFTYGRSYLGARMRSRFPSPQLPLRRAIAPVAPLMMANSLRDGAPDAWGRRVIINRLTGLKGDDAREPWSLTN